MLASRKGHTATVELLLGAGADMDAEDKVRVT
jgi:ankyrin repeat protein